MRLIDADAIKIKPVYMHDICGVVMIRVEDIARILNDMPTISPEPERKKGKWLAYGDIPTTCPYCHEDWDKYVYGDIWYSGELPNYCPNCGEEVRGGHDEID